MSQRRAVQLRLAGAGTEEIARAIDTTTEQVEAWLASYLSAFEILDREQELVLELSRIEELHRAVWPAAVNRDVQAVREAAQLMERRAALVSELRRYRTRRGR